ncbi:hypothetical protein GM661_00495 [Iocasia frigidifontis]|uniref:Uncharacterized protein n=1 Tax=Iocasia fonsfrigidae TaxID=2682810 RepID=A0A8A7KFA0_9FIRM|nr:hypothetical protein [Iocasia fonsfrigidae]QTL96552.1 hypothetical protein GM661_00495 [Iocasia fonsfrigidae]
MVSLIKPDWFEKWVIVDEDGWHLKKEAPEKVKEEFEVYMKEINEDMLSFE